MKHYYRRSLVAVSVLAAVLMTVTLVAVGAALVAAPEEMASEDLAVAKLPRVAIGAMRMSGIHLVPPRDDVVLATLLQEGAITLDSTPQEIQAARDAYVREFAKKSDTWVSAEFREWALGRERELGVAPAAEPAVQPVTATVFALAVDFGATETFTLPIVQADGSCLTQTVTITGPLAGQMNPPGAGDNNTLWYSPSLTTDAKFYEKIIFGYEGAGRARYDLTDPVDGQPGINLAGYTVQDYYDGVAGDGNVYITGTVEGWATVNHSEGYYGADNCATGSSSGGAGVPVATLVIDAIGVFSDSNPTYYTDTSADAFWPRYDANGDGVLDTFWVIHSGAGQESGGGAEGTFSIWSHSSDLRHQAQWEDGYKIYEGDVLTTTDDIVVGPYTMQPENAETGVFAEEFGHNFFGLPDLYTTDASNSIGDWAIMSGGAWMGWLGGTAPTSMPLWFKMIAAFEDGSGTPQPVNWHQPMVTRAYDGAAGDVTIGQLEKTPDGVSKGVRVNLPDITMALDNEAGSGKGAYSGTGRDQVDVMLQKQIAVGSAATGTLTMASYWEIEEDWDYGYVMVNGSPIVDMDGITTDFNPNGNNLGNGLTGSGAGTLRFDLSAYAGETVTVTLRYKTDAAVTEPGWWVDDVALDGTLIDGFEGATAPGTFDQWTNSSPGWFVVPKTDTFSSYYLVEWRTKTKYDKMVETAYVTEISDDAAGVWKVNRVPYNIPGALVYYRNSRYGATYAMLGNAGDVPSYGSKYQLLIVDMNWPPMRLGNTPATYEGYLTGRASSYDSALTLQATDAFTLPAVLGADGGPWPFPSKPAVTSFSDAKGYYAGFYYGSPCDPGYVCYAGRDDSAVIPARGPYSVRVTDFAGNPFYGLYGIAWSPSWLGSGKPGDDNVQYGVNIELLSKAGDDGYNSTATLRFGNGSVDIETTRTGASFSGITGDAYTVTYQTVVENTGTETAATVNVTYTLDSDLTLISLASTAGTVGEETTSWSATNLTSGSVITVTLVATGSVGTSSDTLITWVDAHDGSMTRGPWFYSTGITTYSVYLPLVLNN